MIKLNTIIIGTLYPKWILVLYGKKILILVMEVVKMIAFIVPFQTSGKMIIFRT